MDVGNIKYQTIWVHPNDNRIIQIIDQRCLPFEFIIEDLKTLEDVYTAISDMHVRGAPLIGVTGAFGMYLAVLQYQNDSANIDKAIENAASYLKASRPTAVNLKYALDSVKAAIQQTSTIDE